MEVMISLSLFTLLSAGVFASITTLHNISRRQATYSSVLALVIQEQEAIRSLDYSPPNVPYTVAKHTSAPQQKSVSLNSAGDYMVDVAIVSTFEPELSGHLVTVSATYTFNGKSVTIETTTLINKHSST